MTKSEKFLDNTYNALLSYYNGDGSTDDADKSDGITLTYIRDIFELIKQNRFDDLQSYINDDCAYTPNKNYSYSLRDKISNEIKRNIKFIEDYENNL